jgi:hypothetical protein
MSILLGNLVTGVFSQVASQQNVTSVSLSKIVAGRVLSTHDYVVWLDSSNNALYGFSLATRTTFSIVNNSEPKYAFATDNQNVVWVQAGWANSGASIQGYNFKSGKQFEIISAHTNQEFGGLALANNTLYYKDASAGHNGLYALDLVTTQEQLISQFGQNPVAADGLLIWSEEKYQGNYIPSEWTLRLLERNSTNATIIELARGEGQFEVSTVDKTVVWSALPPAIDQRVYAYNHNQGQSRIISSGSGRKPIVAAHKVAWVEASTTNTWAVQLFDTTTNTSSTFIKPGTAKIDLAGFTGSAEVVFTVYRDSAVGKGELYLARVSEPTPNFNAAPSNPPVKTNAPPNSNPLDCGQVYRQGYSLYDCNGRWTVNGVQFILPEYGINGHTFRDSNYKTSIANGQIDYWLDKAANFLGARTLRIFVDMPYDILPGPTGPATLYDFALRASNRGMRLGVVLHNDTSWTLTPTRKEWLSQFIAYFRDRNALPLLAYLSADNEINNHCGNAPDCYDNNPIYVEKANRWVADFTTYVKSLNPAILTTVGISTEKADADGQLAVYNFFRTASSSPSLAASVDFLSPHNYGAGGYSIWGDLRYKLGYQGAIVLEEYGFATDPLGMSTYYKEGEPICREDPYQAVCYRSAPYFVEVNARSIRENNFDGFAGGSAWMLADSNYKDCTSPFDFYTGLFASGNYASCGGTRTTTPGAPKSLAARIRFHYLGSTDFNLVAPSNLTATATDHSQVSLSWSDNSPNELNFRIERKTEASGSWTEIATVSANTNSYRDNNLLNGTIFYYRIRAYTNNGNASYSAYSGEANALTLFPAPTNLSASLVSITQISLKWNDNSNGETGFKIERKTGQGNWIEIGTTGADITSYVSGGLQENTFYTFRVVAYNNAHNSGYSAQITALTYPAAPANLQGTVSSNQIVLGWTDRSNGESGFRVERKMGLAGSWEQLSLLPANTTNYQDTKLISGQSYFYRVATYNSTGISGYSDEINLTFQVSPDYIVTNPDASAVGVTDSLTYALENATVGQTVLLAPIGNIISVTVQLPPLRPGVNLIGRCSDTIGPEITIKGLPSLNGFNLLGNNVFYGIRIYGFKGPVLKILAGGETGNNLLNCIRVS